MELDSKHRPEATATEATERGSSVQPTAGSAVGGSAPSTGQIRDGVAIGLAVVVVGVIGIMAALGEFLVDVVPFLVAFVGLSAWTARSSSRAARWITAALMLVMLAVNSIYAIGDLSHPESAPAFVPTVVVMGGGAVTIVLAVLSALRRPAQGGRVWAVAGVGFAALAATSIIVSNQVDDAVAQAGDEVVTASDFEYPEKITIESGSGLLIDNEDPARHTFVIDGPDGNTVEIPASSTARTEVDLAPGTYRFYCDIAGHEDMEGTLEVS